MTPSSPTKFAIALRAFFAQHLPLTRGLSPRTVSSYRDTFVLLLRFLAARHGCGVVDLELLHLRADDALAFLDHLETERKNSVATRNARLAAMHAFARFLATRSRAGGRGPAPCGRTHQARTSPRRRLSRKRRNRRNAGGRLAPAAGSRPRSGVAAHSVQHRRPGAGTARSASKRSATGPTYFRSPSRQGTQGAALSAMARDSERAPRAAGRHTRVNGECRLDLSQPSRRTDDPLRCPIPAEALRPTSTDSSPHPCRQACSSTHGASQRGRPSPTCGG